MPSAARRACFTLVDTPQPANALTEVEVYVADGNLFGRDRQVRTRLNGQKTVQRESIAGRGARAGQTEARVRAMGPPSSAR